MLACQQRLKLQLKQIGLVIWPVAESLHETCRILELGTFLSRGNIPHSRVRANNFRGIEGGRRCDDVEAENCARRSLIEFEYIELAKNKAWYDEGILPWYCDGA